jgi:hypothetical protein
MKEGHNMPDRDLDIITGVVQISLIAIGAVAVVVTFLV